VGVGSIFEAGVFLKTEGQSINAIEGKIFFPNDLVELTEVRDGNSLVSLWVKKPQVTEAGLSAEGAGEIFFSGLVPGGFVGEDGYLFSLFFEAQAKGQVRITIAEEQILLADGQGSKAFVKQAPLVVSIEDIEKVDELSALVDSDPPEFFTPQVTRDSSVFDGKWFLIFATQDKGSGIDHYEVREGGLEWKMAESPYVLEDQGLGSDVLVKAVDKAGNEKVETLARQNLAKWYANYAVWIIIIGIAFLFGLAGKILWRKKKTQNSK
jgi:hypothetical protein